MQRLSSPIDIPLSSRHAKAGSDEEEKQPSATRSSNEPPTCMPTSPPYTDEIVTLLSLDNPVNTKQEAARYQRLSELISNDHTLLTLIKQERQAAYDRFNVYLEQTINMAHTLVKPSAEICLLQEWQKLLARHLRDPLDPSMFQQEWHLQLAVAQAECATKVKSVWNAFYNAITPILPFKVQVCMRADGEAALQVYREDNSLDPSTLTNLKRFVSQLHNVDHYTVGVDALLNQLEEKWHKQVITYGCTHTLERLALAEKDVALQHEVVTNWYQEAIQTLLDGQVQYLMLVNEDFQKFAVLESQEDESENAQLRRLYELLLHPRDRKAIGVVYERHATVTVPTPLFSAERLLISKAPIECLLESYGDHASFLHFAVLSKNPEIGLAVMHRFRGEVASIQLQEVSKEEQTALTINLQLLEEGMGLFQNLNKIVADYYSDTLTPRKSWPSWKKMLGIAYTKRISERSQQSGDLMRALHSATLKLELFWLSQIVENIIEKATSTFSNGSQLMGQLKKWRERVAQVDAQAYRQAREKYFGRRKTLEVERLIEARTQAQNAKMAEESERRDACEAGLKQEIIEQRQEITGQRQEITGQRQEITGQRQEITEQRQQITEQRQQITEQGQQITEQKQQIHTLMEIGAKRDQEMATLNNMFQQLLQSNKPGSSPSPLKTTPLSTTQGLFASSDSKAVPSQPEPDDAPVRLLSESTHLLPQQAM